MDTLMTTKVVVLILLLSGCATPVVQTKMPCPLFPDLQAISVEQQIAMDPVVLVIVLENQLALKKSLQRHRLRLDCKPII